MGDDDDGAAGVLGNGNQVVKLGSRFVGVVHRAGVTDIRTHRVENQQLGVVLLHGFTDTVIPEGQALFVLLDEDESVAVTICRIKSRHNGIVCIVLGGLIDNGHRLAALVLIGKGKRCSLGKQSGKRKHQLTLAVSGVALQQCDLAERNIRIPQPAHLLGYNLACLDDFQLCWGVVRIVCHCLVLLFDR